MPPMPARRDTTGAWRYRKVVVLPDGRRERISGTPRINTKMDAERAEREHIAQVLSPAHQRAGIPTLAEFVPRYLEVVAMRQAASEMHHKRLRLDRVILPALGALRLDQIGRAELDALKVSLRSKAPRTVNNYLTVVGAVLAYAVQLGLIAGRPDMGMLPVPPQPFEVYSDDEIDRLVAVATDPNDRAALLLGADAGLRAGEIRALRRDDIGAGKVRIIHSEWRGHLKAPKSGRARTVPMTVRLAEAVSSVLASHASPTVLVGRRGLSWTWDLMRDRLRERLAPDAGVEARGWHALRHAFGSRLAAAGAPARSIQALMGHASITTTERYMHMGPDAAASAIALLDHVKTVPNPIRRSRKAR
jgi:integrase